MQVGRSSVALAIAAFWPLVFSDARAVPSFARQTGMDCTTCHRSWLQYTAYSQFNSGDINYANNGRNAADNNFW